MRMPRLEFLGAHFLTLLLVYSWPAQAAPPPASAFTERMKEVWISPEGRYVLYVSVRDGKPVVVTVDRQNANAQVAVLSARAKMEVIWCRWVSNARLACAFREARVKGKSDHPREAVTIFAVNSDGSQSRRVFQFGHERDAFAQQIAAIRSAKDGLMFVQRQEHRRSATQDNYLSFEICRLNTLSGECSVVLQGGGRFPGVPRILGYEATDTILMEGVLDGERHFWTRVDGDRWIRSLFSYHALEAPPRPLPVALIPNTRDAYAIGLGKVHQALYKIDLTSEAADRLVYESDKGDLRGVLRTGDGRLLGMGIEALPESVHYLDTLEERVASAVNEWLPDTLNEVVDSSQDRRIFLIRSSSHWQAPLFYIFDMSAKERELEYLGASYPELNNLVKSQMRSVRLHAENGAAFDVLVSTPASDGRNFRSAVVMPDDGPQGRARGRFSFLRSFLLSRGYTVIQLKRDDTVAARDRWAARPDLHKAPEALIEAARWSVAEGIAHEKRIVLLGWGYGGYVALLTAEKDPARFGAIISINAVTELDDFRCSRHAKGLVGNIPFVLSGDRPRRLAGHISAPVLLIAGRHDAVIHPHQTRDMAQALKFAQVPHEHRTIELGTHEFSNPDARAEMLTAIDRFLAERLVEHNAGREN